MAEPLQGGLSFRDTRHSFIITALPRGRPAVRLDVDGASLLTDRLDLYDLQARRAFTANVNGRAPAGSVERELLELVPYWQSLGETDTTGPETAGEAKATDEANDGVEPKRSQASNLVQLVTDLGAEFFHTPDQTAYASFPVGDHTETWALRTKGFRQWAARQFYLEFEKVPASQALADTLNVLEGRALHEGPELPVYVRIAETDGALYLDLCDRNWRAVEITPSGWRIVNQPPVRFRRARGMLPLPEPAAGGCLDDLRPFLNVRDSADFILILAWLLMALRGRGPYPALAWQGEQGAAKSTSGRVLKALIDPNTAPLRSEPRETRDLMIAATNGWLLAFDNISHLPPWLSDALCRLATGGGFATRELYSDAEEAIFDAMRPVVLTGIEEFVTRPDLLDRTIVVTLPQLPERRRKPEQRFWAEFDRAAPRILGALLTAVCHGLAAADRVQLTDLPRMADFAIWAYAALGDRGPAFLKAYGANRQTANALPLDSDPIVAPLWIVARAAWDRGPDWTGTASELLDALARQVDEKVSRRKDWPADGTRLSNRLRRLAPNLRAEGLEVVFTREGRARRITLQRPPESSPDDEDPEPSPVSDSDVYSADEAEQAGFAASSASQDDETFRLIGDSESAEDPERTGHRGPTDDAREDGQRHQGRAASPAASQPAGGNPGASESKVPPNPKDHDAGAANDADIPLDSGLASALHTGAAVTVVDDAAALNAALSRLLQAPELGLDTETTGLDPRADRLRLIQFATPEQVYVIDCTRVEPRLLAPLFERGGPILVGQNLVFDLQFLAAVGLPVPNGARLFDTMLAAQLLSAGLPNPGHGLADLAARYLGLTLDKRLQTSDWSGSLSEEQIRYAALDAAVLLPLLDTLTPALHDADLDRVMAIELGCLPAVAWLKQTGAPFAADRWAGLSDAAVAEQLRLGDALTSLAGATDLLGKSTINWSSPEQVARLLRAQGHAVQNTDEATLRALAECEPLAGLLLQYREASRRAGTYGIEFLQHLHPATGRIHADYHQLGSVAGRMACRNPNLQQIPRDPGYRACFRPADGRVLVKADYSQIELRLAAQISGDAGMRAAFAEGLDVHAKTAAAISGKPLAAVTKDDRRLAKAVNFGLLYGMGTDRLRTYAASDYGVTLTEAAASRVRNRFFGAYPGLRAWHRSIPKEAIETRTLAGRRRLSVERFTEKLNTPVQGSGADLLKLALARLWEHRDAAPTAAPVLCVHDEIVLECAADDAEPVAAWLRGHMMAAAAVIMPDVPAEVEVTIAKDWAGGDG